MNPSNKLVFIVMGVSGCGKSTIGQMLAEALKGTFHDGDDFHPKENVAKMSAGIPLTDEDRWPWLRSIRESISQDLANGKTAVYACSALKAVYREILAGPAHDVQFIYLKGTPAQILKRMQRRSDHFMPAELLASQFDTLEEPEDAWVISIDQAPEVIIQEVLARIAKS